MQIPALNDSKYVGISVYNVTIMCVLGVAVSIVLSDEQTASFLLIASFIIFCNTSTLSLVFVPKIIDLKRDPKGQKSGKATMKVTGMKINNKPVQSTNDMLQIAKRVNVKLRNAIVEVEKEIALAMALESKTAAAVAAAAAAAAADPEPPQEPPQPPPSQPPLQPQQPTVNGTVNGGSTDQLKEKVQSTSTVTSDYFSSNSKSQCTSIKKELDVAEDNFAQVDGEEEEEEQLAGKAGTEENVLAFLTQLLDSCIYIFFPSRIPELLPRAPDGELLLLGSSALLPGPGRGGLSGDAAHLPAAADGQDQQEAAAAELQWEEKEERRRRVLPEHIGQVRHRRIPLDKKN